MEKIIVKTAGGRVIARCVFGSRWVFTVYDLDGAKLGGVVLDMGRLARDVRSLVRAVHSLAPQIAAGAVWTV